MGINRIVSGIVESNITSKGRFDRFVIWSGKAAIMLAIEVVAATAIDENVDSVVEAFQQPQGQLGGMNDGTTEAEGSSQEGG